MSGIISNAGLISGLPIQDLIDSLMTVQQQPVKLLSNRLSAIGSRRAALLQLSAKLLGVQNAVSRLSSATSFSRTQATSTNTSAIVATAGTSAATGSYSFSVRSLAASHQVISAGFATSDASPIGAGTITIERAEALLNRSTSLSSLHGEAGVQLGRIRITDRAGGSAEIDLVAAHTIDDVLRLINEQGGAKVHATIDGDHIKLADQTGLASGSVSVTEVAGGRTAADLGIWGASSTGEITGQSLVGLAESTRLASLNDGNGVRWLEGQPDIGVSLADGTTLDFSFSDRVSASSPLAVLNRGGGVPAGTVRITQRNGQQFDIDLSSATTLGDVETTIEAASSNLSVTISGSKLVLSDTSTGEAPTKVEEIGTGTTAAALGLVGQSTTGTISGTPIYFVETLGDLLRTFNMHPGNAGKLSASIAADGTGIVLTDLTSGGNPFSVIALNGSHSAEDLGLLLPASGNSIESRRLVAGLNTVLLRSLRGGAGIETGVIQLTDKSGASATVDLTGSQTLADVLSSINAAGIGITASVSANGLGIELRDTSSGSGNLIIADLTGQSAAHLGITANTAANSVKSGNLQKQYVSAASLLDDFNQGAGIVRGRFRITDSGGQSAVVDLTQGNEQTLQDVIDEINSRGIGVTARINDTGDGLLIEDTAGGGAKLKIIEEGSTTAASLGIVGEASDGQTSIDGTLEARINLGAGDTLRTLVDKIQASRAPASASVINDGSAGRPFRLSLTSDQSGLDGLLAIDAGSTAISFSTLTEARNATVVFGAADAGQPLILNSESNVIDGAVEGVRLDLVGTTSAPVTINVTRDMDSLIKDISGFVSAYNAVTSALDELTQFNTETQQRSVLSGDATARRIRERMLNMVNRGSTGGSIGRLSQVGITLGAGASLQFDEEKFREAFDADPAAVQEFFTQEPSGYGLFVKDEIKRLTETDTGVISIQDEALSASEELLRTRIGQLETLLVRRRERLVAQFNAMESSIASLQTQQTALTGLSSLSIPK